MLCDIKHDNVKQRMMSLMRIHATLQGGERLRWRSCVVTVHLYLLTKKKRKKKEKATIFTTPAMDIRCGANEDEKAELIVCESARA